MVPPKNLHLFHHKIQLGITLVHLLHISFILVPFRTVVVAAAPPPAISTRKNPIPPWQYHSAPAPARASRHAQAHRHFKKLCLSLSLAISLRISISFRPVRYLSRSFPGRSSLLARCNGERARAIQAVYAAAAALVGEGLRRATGGGGAVVANATPSSSSYEEREDRGWCIRVYIRRESERE